MNWTEQQIELEFCEYLRNERFGGRATNPIALRRQIPIPGGGLPDVCLLERVDPNHHFILTIYEIKKGLVGLRAIEQLLDYMDSVRDWWETTECNLRMDGFGVPEIWIWGALVGAGFVDRPVARYLRNWCHIESIRYEIREGRVSFQSVAPTGEARITSSAFSHFMGEPLSWVRREDVQAIS